MLGEVLDVTFFERTKREADLPQQATDDELLAWAQELKHEHKLKRPQLRAAPPAKRTRPLVAAGR